MQLRALLITTLLLVTTAPVVALQTDGQVAQQDWATELGRYLSQLDASPNDQTARKGAWQCAMRLGLYEQAADLHAQLTAPELQTQQGDQIALAIRYGRIDARTLTGPERYRALDRAIAQTDTLAAAFNQGQALDPEQQRRLLDRMVALVARQRPQSAIDLYQQFLTRHIAVPDWALNDLADAYLTLRQPLVAASIYRQVLVAKPDDFNANLGLSYALLESEQVEQAQAQIDAYAASVPMRRHLDGQANDERTSAELTADLQRVYTNQIADARTRIAARLAVIPYNQEARAVENAGELALGWLRSGEAGLRSNINNDPNNANLRAEHVDILLSLQRWDDAETELQTAQQLDADLPRVELAADTMALWRSPALHIDAGYGQGQNQDPFGSSDYHVDTTIYSSPFDKVWRVFLHNYSANADLYGDSVDWTRTGAGAEWRSGDWLASAEINGGAFAKTGVLTELEWNANDFWQLVGSYASVGNDTPLQAVQVGVTAQQVNLGMNWQPYDGRKLTISTNFDDFSDGNRRSELVTAWSERLVSGPRWQLDSTLGADASHNTLGYSVAYFNPPDAHSVWISGTLENLTWRNYDWSLRQRLSLSLGDYWQSGFERGTTEAIEYQHRWELGRSAALNYSLGRNLRPYDGVREARNYGTLTLLWRF